MIYGEPWNTIAQQKDVGRIVASGISLRPHSCEKVFTVTQKWALSHRAQLASLIIALQQACHWLSNPENTQQMIDILSLPPYLDRHIADLHPVQLTPLLPLFNHSNQPVVDEAEYLLEQMNHWGQVKPEQASAVASEVFATEIYNEAMTELSTPLEINDAK